MALPAPAPSCTATLPYWFCRLAPAPLISAIQLFQQHQNVVAVGELAACLALAAEDPVEAEVCLRLAILKLAEQQAKQALTDLGRWLRSKLTQQQIQNLTEAEEMAVSSGQILTNPPACVTGSSTHKGICCAAVTQFGLSQAALGFQYTSCKGRTVCLACGTKSSVSKRHPGQAVFDVKRVSCGPSGCPALVQAGIVPAI